MSDSKSIEKQGKRVKELAKRVKEGKINLQELNELSSTLQELSDKVAVLKYLMAKNDFSSADIDLNENIRLGNSTKTTEPETIEKNIQNIVEEKEEVTEEAPKKEETPPAFSFNLFDAPAEAENIERESFDSAQGPSEQESHKEKIVVDTLKPELEIAEQPIVEVQEESSEALMKEDDNITLDQLTPAQEPEVKAPSHDSSLQSAIQERQGNASLNDSYFGAQDNSLASKLKNTPIENLKSAIGINVKFTFINELFGGNSDEFNHVVDAIDSMGSADDARNLLGELSGKHSWDLESHSVSQFVEMVERRFM